MTPIHDHRYSWAVTRIGNRLVTRRKSKVHAEASLSFVAQRNTGDFEAGTCRAGVRVTAYGGTGQQQAASSRKNARGDGKDAELVTRPLGRARPFINKSEAQGRIGSQAPVRCKGGLRGAKTVRRYLMKGHQFPENGLQSQRYPFL